MYFLKLQAQNNPHKTCINNLTYEQAYKQVIALAHGLKNQLGKSKRLALLAENSPNMAILLYALFLIKVEVLTLNTQLQMVEIDEQLNNLDIDLLICSDKIICKDNMLNCKILKFSEIFDLKSIHNDFSDDFSWEMPNKQIAVIMNTSATSGQYKSVPITWGQILAHVKSSSSVLGVEQNDNWLIVLPIFHVSGLMILLRSLYNGTAVYVEEKFNEERVLDLIHKEKINLISLVPSILNRIIDKIEKHKLRLILLGGEFIPTALVEKCRLKALPIYKTYGMTEHTSQITTFNILARQDKINSVGKALPEVEIQIKNMQEDGIGEIWVKSPMLMQGYLNHPNSLDSQEFFNTDDFGYLDQDNFLFLLNRRKDLIISGGENIYPKEIEDLLYNLPQVLECVVLGIEDEKWGQVPILHIVSPLSDQEILTFLSEKLAKYKLPKKIIRHSELPKNSTGKIMRNAL